jgi:hypothetical protein
MSSEEIDAKNTFLTYFHYVSSFSLLTRDPQALRGAQVAIPEFVRLKSDGKVSIEALRRPLYRGWLTLRAMETLPIDKEPELAVDANLWLPVQSYYAIHGVGLAALEALRSDQPSTHSSFLREASASLARTLLPRPFSITCTGDIFPGGATPASFSGTGATRADTKAINALSAPTQSNAETFVAKAIATTRDHAFEASFDHHRKQRRKSRLNRAKKQQLAGRIPPTSVFDFLYRYRLRSNYSDVDTFRIGQTEIDMAVQHYKHVLTLTLNLVTLLHSIIERRIGIGPFTELRKRFKANRTSDA